MGTSPLPKGGGALLQFSAHAYCDQTAVCIRIPLDKEVGLSLGDIVLDGDPAPPPLKRHSPQFLANVRCGQTTGWTMMPLRMEVGLGQATLCSMETQKKGTATHPILAHVYCDQTAGWIKMPLGTEVDLGPGNIVLDGDTASPRKGHISPLLFSAHVYCGHRRPSQLLLSCCPHTVTDKLFQLSLSIGSTENECKITDGTATCKVLVFS